MKKLIFIYILIFSIIGCTTTSTSTLTVNTSTPVSVTISPAVTLESSQDVCKKVEQVSASEVKSQGNMIFTNISHDEYKVDAVTFEKSDLIEEGRFSHSIAISPNREFIALQFYSQKNEPISLRVKSQDGLLDTTIPWEEEWNYIASWLDNQRLLINTYIEVEDWDIQAKEFSTFLVINPFTNERKVLEPVFPEIYSHHMFPYWGKFGSTIYSPNLDKVIYLRESDEGYYSYVLWSIEEQKSLADFRLVLDKDIPQWSPDGKKFAMSPSLLVDSLDGKWPANNLYVVDSDGQSTKITNLSEYFTWTYIGRISWSPNERYIAFWFSGWDARPYSFTITPDQYLGVVDVETKNLRIYCISGDIYPGGVAFPPVWSPDGTQILVESPLSDEHSQVLLLDLEKEVIAKIGEDMIPVGWMINP